jgi:hypothetical protein
MFPIHSYRPNVFISIANPGADFCIFSHRLEALQTLPRDDIQVIYMVSMVGLLASLREAVSETDADVAFFVSVLRAIGKITNTFVRDSSSLLQLKGLQSQYLTIAVSAQPAL